MMRRLARTFASASGRPPLNTGDRRALERNITQELRLCSSAEEIQRCIIAPCAAIGFSPGEQVYTTLLDAHRSEGNGALADELERGLSEASLLHPTASPGSVGALRRLAQRGEIGLAWAFFEQCLAAGSVESEHCEVVLSMCPDADRMQQLVLDRVPGRAIETSCSCTLLVARLLRAEGRVAAASERWRSLALGVGVGVTLPQLAVTIHHLVRDDEGEDAWCLFGALHAVLSERRGDGVAQGGAARAVYHAMLGGCTDSTEAHERVICRMAEVGIEPDAETRELLRALGANERSDANEMVQRGSPANGACFSSGDGLLRRRPTRHEELGPSWRSRGAERLRLMIKGGRWDEACSLYAAAVERRDVTIHHANSLLVGCASHAEMVARALYPAVSICGVSPNVHTRNALLTQLLLEGVGATEAEALLSAGPAAKAPRNALTESVMGMTHGELGVLRTAKLGSLLRCEGREDEAWVLLGLMDAALVSDTDQYNVMALACSSAEEVQQRIVCAMQSAGLSPDARTYALLIRRVRLDGLSLSQSMGAQRGGLLLEMEDFGIEPDKAIRHSAKASVQVLSADLERDRAAGVPFASAR